MGTSVAFGRRVLVPLALEFMGRHPQLRLDPNFDDRYAFWPGGCVGYGLRIAPGDSARAGMVILVLDGV